MERRSRVRKAEEVRRMPQAQNNEEEPQDNDSTNSESDHEEELEASDEDSLEGGRDSARDGADSVDDMIAREADRIKSVVHPNLLSAVLGVNFFTGKTDTNGHSAILLLALALHLLMR